MACRLCVTPPTSCCVAMTWEPPALVPAHSHHLLEPSAIVTRLQRAGAKEAPGSDASVPLTQAASPLHRGAGCFPFSGTDKEERRAMAVASAPAAVRVRVWEVLSRGPGPRRGCPPPEGVNVAYPPPTRMPRVHMLRRNFLCACGSARLAQQSSLWERWGSNEFDVLSPASSPAEPKIYLRRR